MSISVCLKHLSVKICNNKKTEEDEIRKPEYTERTQKDN